MAWRAGGAKSARKRDEPKAPPGVRVSIREETIGDIKVRRKVTQKRSLGGVALTLAFVLGMLALGVAIAVPAVARVGGALVLVLFLGVLIRFLNLRYEEEVRRRIQSAREQFRQQRYARSRRQAAARSSSPPATPAPRP